ncbi:hypothetical protein C8D70_11224 [Chryseobacterium sp. CBTAP 102]|uniref:hypothetical protein n=1 Tax=Chryseobacterium sp. CBTAP 102 TaxID=2135644 RepID=UPI000D774D6F|nr:hypothetical protein [Chryseobacterium sp. CBTAP 102]PXW11023.1 hypothetical protein C8D70_11224 [Chryseobacterium sp. CBTAP 102]
MKKALLFILPFIFNLLTAQNNDNICKYLSENLKEKPLECIDKSTFKENNEVYQFFKWSAFRDNHLLRIEKKGHKYILVKKKIYTSEYDQKTGEKRNSLFTILVQKNLTQKQYVQFMKLLSENHFWLNNNYDVPSNCTDGNGIFIYAMKKNSLLKMSNGNCAPHNEYLNDLYQKITKLFNLSTEA